MTPEQEHVPTGAHGLALEGLAGVDELFGPVEAGASLVRLSSELSGQRASRSESEVVIRLQEGGAIVLDEAAGTIRFGLERHVPAHDLVHPYLAPAASLWNQWSGRDCWHAGAFAVDGRAVLVLAPREGGKSTTLAAIASLGLGTVLCDDLAVLDGSDLLAGPRSIDLRPGAPEAGELLVRDGGRRRVLLPVAPARTPVVAVIVLQWGSDWEVLPVRPTQRLTLLDSARMAGPRRSSASPVLRLAWRPMLIVRRRREAANVRSDATRLVECLSTSLLC